MKKFIAAAIIASIATTPAFADSNNNTQPTTPEVVQVQENTENEAQPGVAQKQENSASEEVVQSDEQQSEQTSIQEDIDYSFSESQAVEFEQLSPKSLEDTTGAIIPIGGEIPNLGIGVGGGGGFVGGLSSTIVRESTVKTVTRGWFERFTDAFTVMFEPKTSTQKEPKSNPRHDTDITLKDTPRENRRTEITLPEKREREPRSERLSLY